MRTKEEIQKELEEVKQKEFLLQMEDHWSGLDYDQSRAYNAKIRALEHELEQVQNGG